MKPSEAAVLLATIARTDQRTVGESTARSWAELLTEADVPLSDAVEAVKYHFGHSADYLMPIHVIHRVKEIRQERLSRAGTPPMPGDLTWHQERAWRQLWCANVKDGMSIEDAAAAASEAMNLPRELPAAPEAAADERKALIQKLADSKAAPKARMEDRKPIERKPRERWGCWWRGFVEADDISDRIVFSANGDTLYHNGGPYGIPINNLCNQPKYWLNHIAGKGWGDSATLASLAVAWADITNASDDERAQAIVWAAEAYDPDHAKESEDTVADMLDPAAIVARNERHAQ